MESQMNVLNEFLFWSCQSKEKFTSHYCKLTGKDAKQLYLLALNELQKAITEGNVNYLKNLSNLIECVSNEESKATVKDFCNDVKNPFKNITLIILACKHNKVEILQYLIRNLNILKATSAEDIVRANDLDETQHNAFYYSIRSGNVELLETLKNQWPEKYFATHSLEFEEILSTAYEELKLRNVTLSDEMEMFVQNELLNLRFFADGSKNTSVKIDHLQTIKQRIQLVLENINLILTEYYSNLIDERFLFIAKFIVQNIHMLKRIVNSTYDKLPWEEIEFCLTCFISYHINQEEFNLFTCVILSKCRILDHLDLFARKLKDVSENTPSFKHIRLSSLKREEVIQQIVKNNFQFQELYNDYQQIRDIYSLYTIHKYINLVPPVDLQCRDRQILITRVLQVIGEHLKNTVESPKLSSTTIQLLLLSLPKNTREIIKELRDSLSHSDSISRRMEIQNNTKNNFLNGVQNDILNVGGVIRDVLYRKKLKIIKFLLNQIISCKSFEEVREILKIFHHIKLDEITSPDFIVSYHKKLENLVVKLCNILTDKTHHEKQLFDSIFKIINFEKSKFEKIKNDYITGFTGLISLISVYNDSKIDSNRLRGLKFHANLFLQSITSETEYRSLKEIIDLLEHIFPDVGTNVRENAEMHQLFYEIFYIAEIEMNNIKCIEELREKITDNDFFNTYGKKTSTPAKDMYSEQLEKKMSEMKSILQNSLGNLETFNNTSFLKFNKKLQAVIEMLVLDIMSILNSLKCLENDSYFLDVTAPLLFGRCLRNHLAHHNASVSLLLPDPSVMLYLNAKKLIAENLITCEKKIGKCVKDDPFSLNVRYNKNIFNIMNQEKMFLSLEKGDLKGLESCLKQGADINAKNLNSWTALHFASKGPCTVIVNRFLPQNIDFNSKTIIGQTPLHIAAAHGKKSTVQFLLKEKHVAVDDTDNFLKTPLHIAAQCGHKGVIDVLLKYGANTSAKDTDGISPLHLAIRNGHEDVVKILLEKEASVDANETMGGHRPLHIAAERGNIELVEFLIRNGANVNSKTDNDYTPLHAALLNGYLEIVNALILEGADVNATVKSGSTPLHFAVKNGYEAIVDVLLKQRANVNSFDKIYNNTPLHYAAKDGYERIVNILLKHKANVNAATSEAMTPLHFAAQGGYMNIAIALLEQGVDANARNIVNCTPLHCASESGHMNMVKELIKHNSLVNAKDIKDFTPLHLAALKNHKDVAEVLIINNADINSKSKYGFSSLHIAATSCSINFIELLIKNKAEIDATNNLGLTPLHLTTLSGHKDAMILLIKHGAQVNAIDLNMSTPLHIAALTGNKDVMSSLIKNKADVNAKNVSHTTPLHLAAESGKKEAVEILIENGADLNVVDKSKRTPLMCAVKNNKKDIIDYLISKKADIKVAGHAALSMAVYAGYIDIVKILLNSKVDIHTRYAENEPVLHIAAVQGHTEIVKILITKGCDVDVKTVCGMTPLSIAAQNGYEELVENLIAKGASINIKNSEGSTPLHFAAYAGHSSVVKVLLNHQVNTKIKDYKKRIPIELAVANGHLEVVKMLIDFIGDINSKGNENWTLLHVGAQQSNLEILKFLLTKGSDVTAKNAAGAMPIHIAAREGFKESVQFLLSKGSDINYLGFHEETVLHYAASYGQINIVKYLIDQGANVNAKDSYDVTPTHVAATFGCKDTTEVLLKHGAAFNATDVFNQKPLNKAKNGDIINLFLSMKGLFGAVKHNDPLDVDNYIKSGAIVNATNALNLTPLHYAASKGYIAVVNILLQNDCNPNASDSKGFTPLHYAVKFSHFDIVKALLYKGAIFDSFSESRKTPFDLAVDKDIIALFKLITETFSNVKYGNCKVIKRLKKLKDVYILKAIMNACNQENKTLVVIAMDNNFAGINELKEILQDDVSRTIDKAVTLFQMDHFEKALSIFKELFEKRSEILGPHNPGTLDIQVYIAKIMFKKGAYKEALDIFEEIFQKQKKLLGLNCKDTLSTRSLFALTLYKFGRYEEALTIFQDVHSKQIELLGPNHTDTLETNLYKALVLNDLRRYEEALSVNREVYEKRKDENNSAALNAQNNIAMVLANQGKYEESLKVHREVLEKKKSLLGTANSYTLRTQQHIANIFIRQKKYSDALMVYKKLINIQKENLGLNHPDTLASECDLANVFIDQGKWFAALKILNNVLIRCKSVWGMNHPYIFSISERINVIKEALKLQGVKESYIIQLLQTDLNIAADQGDRQAVENLLRNGADVNDKDGDGRTPLHYAANKGHVNIVVILLENRADAIQVTNKGKTPLHTAASKGYKNIVKILLQHVIRSKSSFIDAQTLGGNTALHAAAKIGSMDTVLTLLAYGANYSIQNKNRENPRDCSVDLNVISFLKLAEKLFEDAKNGRQDMIEILKSSKQSEFLALINARNNLGKTLLQVAILNKHKKIATELSKLLK